MKITDRVHLLANGSLGTEMSHASDCNVYGIDCGDGFVVIDAGVGQNTESLVASLAQDGIEPGDSAVMTPCRCWQRRAK